MAKSKDLFLKWDMSFFDNPQTMKLIEREGYGVIGLYLAICVYLRKTVSKCKGISEDDLPIIARRVLGIEPEELEAKVKALEEFGFLVRSEGVVFSERVLSDYTEYVETRKIDRERKRAERMSGGCPADVQECPADVQECPADVQECPAKKRKEEKRIEKKRKEGSPKVQKLGKVISGVLQTTDEEKAAMLQKLQTESEKG